MIFLNRLIDSLDIELLNLSNYQSSALIKSITSNLDKKILSVNKKKLYDYIKPV